MLMFFEGETSGGFSFDALNWVDYIIAGVILLGMIIGAKKGFVDQLFGILGTFGAIVGAILLCKAVGNMMSTDGGIFDKVSEALTKAFTNDEGQLMPIYTEQKDWNNAAYITEALSALKIPGFLMGLFTNMFASFSPALPDGTGNKMVALQEVLPTAVTQLVNYAIAFVVLLIVLSVVISILKKILTGIVKIPGISSLDKLLGFILGAVFSSLILVAVCLGISALGSVISKLSTFLDKTVYESYFGKYLAQLVDFISKLVGGFLGS